MGIVVKIVVVKPELGDVSSLAVLNLYTYTD
jgi:hypothetical protein